ncbi:unnamed protein product, partial [Mesorhabditis belari]|uniref:Exocyst complex component 5 n=1 Tax=Mesorhabditis belari TaxID=2138241 RepID=A0AAF3FK07_9BILA
MSGQYFVTYVEDLEQDPFDATDFVERVVWRITQGADTISDPLHLKEKLEEEIASLQMLCDQFSGKINVLEQQLDVDKRDYCNRLQQLHELNSDAIEKVKQLDQTMQNVSTAVVHLGDQLESVDGPRTRASEALALITHFDQFLSDQPLSSAIFTDPDKLLESADLIQKLYSISQELSKEKYAYVQARIAHRYEEIERLLIDEFVRSQRDEKKMAEVAKILAEFKGYGSCVDRYVEFLHATSFHRDRGDVFAEALHLCRNAKPKIEAIFPNPMAVIQKLVTSIFNGKLKETVYATLRDHREVGDQEGYLISLAEMYTSTKKLCTELEVLHRYLNSYPKDELDYLNAQSSIILARFYESKKHQKRAITSGGLQELRRDVTIRFLSADDFGGETFLAEDVAISILQETKNAFNRTQLFCNKMDVSRQAEKVLDVLLAKLVTEHLDYAVELALAGITLSEPKTEPPAYFFTFVPQNTAIVLLCAKQFEDSIWPLIKNTSVEQTCSKKWTSSLRGLENKINTGMDRHLNAIQGYTKFVLTSTQKKPGLPDHFAFPENANLGNGEGCDGANLKVVQVELAQRLYKTILAHIQNFTYNSAGAMLLLCDLNEYKKCISSWRCGRDASAPFDKLHSLANLLMVLPDNLSEAARSPTLADVDRSLISSFIQLRDDFKKNKNMSLLIF